MCSFQNILDEAAAITGRESYARAAGQMQRAAAAWDEIAGLFEATGQAECPGAGLQQISARLLEIAGLEEEMWTGLKLQAS